jgi:hypothetical protein
MYVDILLSFVVVGGALLLKLNISKIKVIFSRKTLILIFEYKLCHSFITQTNSIKYYCIVNVISTITSTIYFAGSSSLHNIHFLVPSVPMFIIFHPT